MKVSIINYGMGNLASVRKAFEDLGAEVIVASQPDDIREAHRIVLPGVGAFYEGMDRLRSAGWIDILREAVIQKRKPLLGICLGMQMLATEGAEGGGSFGLNFIPGKVERLDTLGCTLRIPHVGWNEVRYKIADEFFYGIPDCSDFYFVHSFAFNPDSNDHLIATANYGCEVSAVIRNENVFGCQFHPEKSSKAGRQLLINFMRYIPSPLC